MIRLVLLTWLAWQTSITIDQIRDFRVSIDGQMIHMNPGSFQWLLPSPKIGVQHRNWPRATTAYRIRVSGGVGRIRLWVAWNNSRSDVYAGCSVDGAVGYEITYGSYAIPTAAWRGCLPFNQPGFRDGWPLRGMPVAEVTIADGRPVSVRDFRAFFTAP